MLKHNLKFFIRNFIRQKGFSIINITGLSIGMAVSILILLYVFHELSYDRFTSNFINKFSVNIIMEYPGGRFEADRSCGELVPYALEKIPEVMNAVSLYDEAPLVRYGDKVFTENNEDVYFTHPTVFSFFDLNIISGHAESVFNEPYSVVLSEKKAKKYFGDDNPLGKVMTFDNEHSFKVTGIFEDYPENSHVQFGMLCPLEAFLLIQGIPDLKPYGNSAVTYVETIDDADCDALCDKLEEATYSFVPKKFREEMNVVVSHYLTPISRIHLFTNFGGIGEGPSMGRIKYVYIFSAVAVFILLLACVNFMNLATARYAGRAREVGLRKIIGAPKHILVNQFLGESIFLSFIALFTAIVLAELLLPVFNGLIEKDLSLIYSGNWKLILGLFIIGLMVGILSGSYPAFFLTSFKPISILHGKLKSGRAGKNFRWSLVVFQFIIALVLVSCTIVIIMQMNYVKKKDLGFNREHLLIIMLKGEEVHKNAKAFKAEISKIPGVIDFSFTSDKPGVSTSWYNNYIYEDREDEDHPPYATVDIDDHYLSTVGLQLVQGRNFSSEFSTDSSAMIINESMVSYLGWNEPIGKSIHELTRDFGRKKYTVIGVIKDFHMESLHKSIGPLMFSMTDRKRYCLVRIHPENIDQTLESLETAWSSISPSRPFRHHFLTNSYDLEYRSEQKLGSMFIYFTAFAIFIACLGVVGLVSFITVGRTKEIGIRKVLGSNTSSILKMISSDFLKMVILALVISVPIAWYIMHKWLERFAYKIDISIWIFVLTGLLAIGVVIASTAYQALKAAYRNPVDAIRYE